MVNIDSLICTTEYWTLTVDEVLDKADVVITGFGAVCVRNIWECLSEIDK